MSQSVYNDFFGFDEEPFNVTPDPDFIFYSDQHKEVLAHMLYGVRERRGFIVVTGRVGSGKTTLCRAFLRELGPDTSTALILNSKMSGPELLESIAEDFGYEVPDKPRSKEVIDSLNDFLLAGYRDGKNACVVIDESQNLSPDALEQLRLLSNLETEKEKLLQIVLVGQPELDDLLDQPELRQLQQRVALRAHLGHLSEDETGDYVLHRLDTATDGEPAVDIEDGVFPRLYRLTDGNPRAINLLADRMLMAAYLDDSYVVSTSHLEDALDDIASRRPPSKREDREVLKPVRPSERSGDSPNRGTTASETESNGKDGVNETWTWPQLRVPVGSRGLLVGSASALATLILGIAVVTVLSWWARPRVVTPSADGVIREPSPAADTPARTPDSSSSLDGARSTGPGRSSPTRTPSNPLEVRPLADDTGTLPDHGWGSLVLARLVSDYVARSEDHEDETWEVDWSGADWGLAITDIVPEHLPGQLVNQRSSLKTFTRYGFPVFLWRDGESGRGRYVLYRPTEQLVWDPARGRIDSPGSMAAEDWRGRGFVLVQASEDVTLSRDPGDRGPPVRWIQRLLNRGADAQLPLTGYFGPLTEQRVRDFQTAHDLHADGSAGPATLLVLLRESGSTLSWSREDLFGFLDRLGASYDVTD